MCPLPTGAEPSPALLVPSAKRRSRKTSKDTGDSKDGGAPGSEEPGAKARGRGRKPSTKAKGGTWARAQPRLVAGAAQLGPGARAGLCTETTPRLGGVCGCRGHLTLRKPRLGADLSEAEL